ncbi:MAG: molybdopterin molybdotransferase MoeA [Steroidobacteraceae bacterium]
MPELDPLSAERLIGAHVACLPIESLPLSQCSGAVLRENVYAERDQPPFDRVTMDGVALASSAAARGLRSFAIQGTQAAGDPPMTLASPEHCIEVMTGAVLPTGCDAVVPVERLTSAEGRIELEADLRLPPWTFVHRRASDRAQGALLLASGSVLRAPEIAVVASAGMARVRVSSQPAIVVVSTGNELVEPGEPIAAHQIRRSNAYAVAAALRQRGFQRVADDHLPDDAAVLHDRLRRHLMTHEVLVLSGGVSMGRFDLVPKALEELGVHCILHGISQRPGRPMWFGTSGDGHAVFALPGNPVSTLVCLVRYVVPALYAAMGVPVAPPERVALSEPVEWQPPLTGFLPVRVAHDEWARPWATPCPTNGSGDFASLALTDGFVELPPGPADLAKGYVSRLHRW